MRRWTPDEDAFLLRWHVAVNAGFIASHDLGRSESAGFSRLKFLTRTGARKAFAQMKLLEIEYLRKAGLGTHVDAEGHWKREILECDAR